MVPSLLISYVNLLEKFAESSQNLLETFAGNRKLLATCTRQFTPTAPAHLGKSISESKIYPDVKNQVCTNSFVLKSRVKFLGVGSPLHLKVAF